MSELAPTLPQWKALYEQALRFKSLACWTWMTEDQIFGVLDPKTGEIGYCCVIGSLAEVFGLLVYLGTEGLAGYQKLRAKKRAPGSIEGLLLHNCLSLTFNDTQYVLPEDLDIIKQLGMKLVGKGAYPVVRNLKPGYLPWPVTSNEALYLTQVLMQVENVCLRLQKHGKLLDPPAPGQYLIRTPEINGEAISWRDQWMKPAPVESSRHSILFDELRVQRLKSRNLEMRGTWEFDYAFTDIPIRETSRPYFPNLLIIADHDTGFIFHNHMAAPDAYPSQFAKSFIECLEKTGFLPIELLVAQEEAKMLLEPITAKLGITLTKIQTCKRANLARREFVRFMAKQ